MDRRIYIMNLKKRNGAKFITIRAFICMVLCLFAATSLGIAFRAVSFPETTVVLLYIVAVLLTALYTNGFLWGMIGSIAATFTFNYFFTEPYYSLSVNNPSYIITFAAMTLVAFVTGVLTSREKIHAEQAIERENEMRVLYTLTNKLSHTDSFEKIGKIAVEHINDLLECDISFVYGMKGDSFCYLLKEKKNNFEQIELKNFIYKENENNDYIDWKVEGQEEFLGIIRIPIEIQKKLNENQKKLLRFMIENIGIAMDRVSSSEERYRDRELMEQERYRANLLRAISHDIRNPLMGIMGTSEMIINITNGDDPRKNLAKGIYQDADWLHSLVENILALTRLQDGKIVLQKKFEPIEEIIASAVRRVEKRASEYEILVEIPEEYVEVPMDAKLIEQVVVNLLDNAVKHTDKSEEIKVIVTKGETEQGQYQVCVAVLDRGDGILEKDIPHIFQMFYTTGTKPADSHYGIGLGLAICETVVKAHGGIIIGKNRTDGKGAVFTFTLPMKGMDKSHV